jgi:hypothetical protein
MIKLYRFTGEWPPLKVWLEYPNWQNALDEEEIEGQDETTLRPSDIQEFIDEDTAFTAGDASLANGESLPALLGMGDNRIDSVDVFVTADHTWRVYWDYQANNWSPFVEDWLPEHERSPSVSLNDSELFPLTVCSRLPRAKNGKPYRLTIHADGSSEEL